MCKCMWLSLTLFISSKACTTNSSAAFLDCLCRAWAVTFVIFGHVNRSRYLLTNAIYAALMCTLVHMITCVQPASLHGPPDSLQLSQLPTSIQVLTCLLNAGRKLLMTQMTQPHESRPHCKLMPIDLAESCSMRMAGDQRLCNHDAVFMMCLSDDYKITPDVVYVVASTISMLYPAMSVVLRTENYPITNESLY